MPDPSLDFNRLWDAEAYAQTGRCPWTIFAYPVCEADERGLPRNDEARRFLKSLLSRCVQVGIWRHPQNDDTVYFACPLEERERVTAVIEELERAGEFATGFARRHTEVLFKRLLGG